MRPSYIDGNDFPLLPDAFVEGLKSLANLAPHDADNFIDALRTARPFLRTRQLSASVLPKLPSIPSNKVRSILSALAALYSLRAFQNKPITSFLEGLDESLRIENGVENGEDSSVQITDEERSCLKERLPHFLDLGGALGVTSKAVDVQSEHENVFRAARVLTDIRPIFHTDSTAPPAAAVTIHTLKIDYRHDYGVRAFFVAMDSADIKALREALDRAEKKSDSIATMLTSANVLNLVDEDE